MTGVKGFFHLQTPNDLLNKMVHDYVRMQEDPLDSYVAFDFFVAAEHMLDWLYPEAKAQRERERKEHALLAICSHIANGAKHFEARLTHHQSVQGEVVRYAKSSRPGHMAVIRGAAGILEVRIRADEAQALDLPEIVDTLDLAERLVDYWTNRLKS